MAETDPTPPAKPITFRPDLELRRELEAYAAKHRWSLNTAVHVLVTQSLETESRLDQPSHPDNPRHPFAHLSPESLAAHLAAAPADDHN